MTNREYRIEKGIKMPEGRNNSVYPFADMDIGDSFSCENGNYKRVMAAAYKYAKYNGKKFSIRSLGDTTRVWRIE